jgi:hypothetical protein
MYGKLCLPQRRAGGVQAVENRPSNIVLAWAVENWLVLAKLLTLLSSMTRKLTHTNQTCTIAPNASRSFANIATNRKTTILYLALGARHLKKKRQLSAGEKRGRRRSEEMICEYLHNNYYILLNNLNLAYVGYFERTIRLVNTSSRS